MSYVDGFLLAIPRKKLGLYRIVYKSRADRDRVNSRVMKDPATLKMMAQMKSKPQPFDMKRMAYGGFKTIVEM